MEPLLPLTVEEKKECYCCDNKTYYSLVPSLIVGLTVAVVIITVIVFYVVSIL